MRPDVGAGSAQGSLPRHRIQRGRTVRLVVGVLLLGLVTAACGDDKGVGDKRLLDIEVQKEQERLGETTTTTTAPPPATPAPGKVGVGATTTPTTAARPVPTTAAAASFDITIAGDRSSTGQFDPRTASVRVGTVVRWVNKDTAARSVEADGGEFVSPLIQPGQSWSFRATAPGQFNYHDGTRPYAVATLEVT